jgi:predicted PurR-regulated permease PerM
MEIVLFTVVAAALYFLSDAILRALERRRGTPLPNRSVVFFALILVLALVSFELIGRVLGPTAGTG